MVVHLSGVSTTSPSFVSSDNLLRVQSVPSSWYIMKLNSILFNSGSWGTPLVTGLQLDFVLHRFMKRKSCLTSLIVLYDEMTGSVGERRVLDVYLKFSKAFGTVSHNVLMKYRLDKHTAGGTEKWLNFLGSNGWAQNAAGGQLLLSQGQ